MKDRLDPFNAILVTLCLEMLYLYFYNWSHPSEVYSILKYILWFTL